MRSVLFVAMILLSWSANAQTLALRVAPVLIDVAAPGRAAQLTLRNEHRISLNVQLRIFKWIQNENGDNLIETDDVAVSPPIMTLAPNVEYVARIVRVAKLPAVAEESYRLLVDELPAPGASGNRTVSFVVRQSIPVFFGGDRATPADVSWSIRPDGKRYILAASNSGTRRLRVAKLTLKDRQGTILAQRPGLVGYVLGGSQVRWALSAERSQSARGALRLQAESETEPIDVSPAPHAAH